MSRSIWFQRPALIDDVDLLITERLDLEHCGNIDLRLVNELTADYHSTRHIHQRTLSRTTSTSPFPRPHHRRSLRGTKPIW